MPKPDDPDPTRSAPAIGRDPHPVVLPSFLETLSARVARLPWSVIIILVGLVAMFYSMTTSALYRRAMAFVTQNPQISTNQIARVAYRIRTASVRTASGGTEDISGTLTAEDSETATVVTQDEQRVTAAPADILNLRCEAPGPDGTCPVGQPVAFQLARSEGTLLFEDLGRLQIRTPFNDTINVLKITVASQVRTPKDCRPNPEGGCEVRIELRADRDENQIKGLLLERRPDRLVVQSVPPIILTIKKSDIVLVINYAPAQCALNNTQACDEGIFLTLGVTVAAFSIAVVVGLMFGLMRVSTNLILFNLSTVYVETIRGVPLLVILLFVNFAFAPWFRDNFPSIGSSMTGPVLALTAAAILFYAVSRRARLRLEPEAFIQPILASAIVGLAALGIILYFRENANLSQIQSAILGLALGYGAFLAELFRAGIQSIGRGQMEAARSLGMTYLQAMRQVILPQAFRVVLPPLGNDFIAMLKDTSLIAVLALPELTQKARQFATTTFRPFEAYITIGMLYLCMTLFLSFVVRVVERRIRLPR